MSRLGASAFILLLLTATMLARAETIPCAMPEGVGFGDFALPRAQDVLTASGKLVVLVVGGASITGLAAGGPGYSMPARLEARLRADLPGREISVATRGSEGSARIGAGKMADAVKGTGAKLVIWETGTAAAAEGSDLEGFRTSLEYGINQAHQAGADIILMDEQYAPSLAWVMNQAPYGDAIRGMAEMEDIPLLPRAALMRAWSDSGELAFDTDGVTERTKVARKLYECLAGVLAGGIAGALH